MTAVWRTVLVLALWCGCTPPARNVRSGGPTRVEVAKGAIDPKPFLRDAVQAARAAGAGELVPIGAAALTEGDQIGSFVRVPDRECLLVIARGGSTAVDVDLFAYDDAGDRLAADEAPEARAAVLVCPPHPRRVYVTARLMTGAGIVALGVMPLPAARADAVAKAVAVRGRPGQDTGKLEAWPGLERQLREHRRLLGSRWDDIRRIALPLEPRAYTALTVTLGARRCLDVFVAPSDEIPGIDVLLLDERGRTLARGKPPGRDRALVLCSEEERRVTVMVRPRLTSGLAAVVIGTSPEGAASELMGHVWVDAVTALLPLAAAEDRLRALTKDLAIGPEQRAASGRAELGAAKPLPIRLEAGCTRIDVVAAVPLGHFEASLWSTDGRRLASAEGGAHATLFHCGPAVTVALEAVATERAGPISVWARRDDKPAAVLLAHPLAASRLLARLEAGLGPVDVKRASSARHVHIEAGRRARVEVPVGAAACVEVLAAVDGGASGIGLVLRDGDRVLSHRRGKEAASVHACSTSGGALALDVDVGSGAAEVLVLDVPR